MADAQSFDGLRAVYSPPSGFSDHEIPGRRVRIVGFTYGAHRDAGGYDQRANTVLAVFYFEDDGFLESAPLHHLRAAPATPEKMP